MASLFSIIAMICGLIVYIVRKDRQESQQLQQSNSTLDIKNMIQKVVEKVDTFENELRETDLCPRTSVGVIRTHSQKVGRKIRIGYQVVD